MNITLWGTSRITYTILNGLLKTDSIKVSKLITTNIETTYPKLKELCRKSGIEIVDTPEIINGINVVAAYGKYITERFFGNPKATFVNIHPSLLPKYRGANPIIATVLAGERKSGVTFHRTVKGLDEGEIFKQFEVEITPNETSFSLENKLAKLAYERLSEVLCKLNTDKPCQQSGVASYADRTLANFDKAHIDWNLPADKLKWFIQGYFDNPIAWTKLNGKILKIYPGTLESSKNDYNIGTLLLAKTYPFVQVACTGGLYTPSKLQFEGKQAVDLKSFANGYFRFDKTVME